MKISVRTMVMCSIIMLIMEQNNACQSLLSLVIQFL